jgi:cytochrome c oxidase assembly protein subunit 15
MIKSIENKLFVPVNKYLISWLWLGIFMVLVQIMLGGITRLTGSGLSITRWDIVTGTLPPLNEAQWEEAFNSYKESPQYQKINQDFVLSDFKFIFFWEYIHRLWARTLGFVFLIPLIYFAVKGFLDKFLIKRLVMIFVLGILAAVFGWVMVKSGLQDRPWVSAYKLCIHLGSACLVILVMWDTLLCIKVRNLSKVSNYLVRYINTFFVFVFIQILLGAIMAGTKAALFYPTWPDMHGEYLPEYLFNLRNWSVYNFLHYDKNPLVIVLIQFLHRSLAYIIFVYFGFIFYFYFSYIKIVPNLKSVFYILALLLCLQICLGIVTLILSVGSIPIFFGAFHQIVGVLFLLAVYLLKYIIVSKE